MNLVVILHRQKSIADWIARSDPH